MKLCLAAIAGGVPCRGLDGLGGHDDRGTQAELPQLRRDRAAPGSGFSPNGKVSIARDGQTLEPLLISNPVGRLHSESSALPAIGQGQPDLHGHRHDGHDGRRDPAVLVIAPSVNIRPADLDVGLRARIGANGFATGKTLYAHIFRTADKDGKRLTGQKPRNLRIGRLKGRCGKLLARKKLFSKRAPLGDYTIQFDTFRRYDEDRPVRFLYAAPVTLEQRDDG